MFERKYIFCHFDVIKRFNYKDKNNMAGPICISCIVLKEPGQSGLRPATQSILKPHEVNFSDKTTLLYFTRRCIVVSQLCTTYDQCYVYL